MLTLQKRNPGWLHLLTVLVAAFSTTAESAQTYPSVPGQEPLQNKMCPQFGGLRPGDSPYQTDPDYKLKKDASGRDFIIGNDCKARIYHLNEAGVPTKESSAPNYEAIRRHASRNPKPPTPPAPKNPEPARTFIADWWTQPGFLPERVEAGRLSVTYEGTGMEWRKARCRLSNGLVVRPGYAVILDNRSLWRLDGGCKLGSVLRIVRPDGSDNFANAQELLRAIEQLERENNRGQQTPASNTLRGDPGFFVGNATHTAADVPPLELFPGQGVTLHEQYALGLSFIQIFRGSGGVPLVLTVQGSSTPAGGRPLVGDWWNEPNLLPATPVAISVRDRARDGRCTLSNGANVPARSIVIPDQRHAYYLNDACQLHALVTLMPETLASLSGGGLRRPGNVSPIPPVAIPAAVTPPTASLAPLIGILTRLWSNFTSYLDAQRYGPCVVIALGAEEAWRARVASGLSAEQIGSAKPPRVVEPIKNPPQAPPIPDDWTKAPNSKRPGGIIATPPGAAPGSTDGEHIRVDPPGSSPVPGLEDGYWRWRQGSGYYDPSKKNWGGTDGATHIPLPPGYVIK